MKATAWLFMNKGEYDISSSEKHAKAIDPNAVDLYSGTIVNGLLNILKENGISVEMTEHGITWAKSASTN